MYRYLTYNDKIIRMKILLAKVSKDVKPVSEEGEESDDTEIYSDHQLSSEFEKDLDSCIDPDAIKYDDCYTGKAKITKWNIKEPRRNVGTPAQIFCQNNL